MATAALEPGVIVAIVVVAVVIAAALGYSGVAKSLGAWRNRLADLDEEPGRLPRGVTEAEAREAELRQLLEAKSYRREQRGLAPLDIEAELARRLESEPAEAPAEDEAEKPADEEAQPPADEASLREEVRQLVIASNERRERRGEPPLDVDAEVERRLRELQQ